MLFHGNRLLGDDSHDMSYLIFSKLSKMSQNVSSAAVVVFAFPKIAKSKISQWLTFVGRNCLRATFLNGKDPDEMPHKA